MAGKLVVRVLLTDAQAQRLRDIAVSKDMCSEDRVEGAAFRALWMAIRDVQEEDAKAPKPDVRPCSRCGREIAHRRLGLLLPYPHNCPHGATCQPTRKASRDRRIPVCPACVRIDSATACCTPYGAGGWHSDDCNKLSPSGSSTTKRNDR